MKPTAQIAQALVSARLAATALPGFPGTLPDGLEAAYASQDAAIALWPDELAGWKVGRIVPPWLARFTRHSVPGLNVLAYNEVPENRRIRVVAAVGR